MIQYALLEENELIGKRSQYVKTLTLKSAKNMQNQEKIWFVTIQAL